MRRRSGASAALLDPRSIRCNERNVAENSRIERSVGDHDLDGLVVRYLATVEEHADRLLEDLCREHPDAAAGLRSRIAILRRLGLDFGAARLEAVPEIAASIRRGLVAGSPKLDRLDREPDAPR